MKTVSIKRQRYISAVGIFVTLLSTNVVSFSTIAQTTPVSIVHLVINYGDGVEKRLDDLKWTNGMTVEDLLKEAQAAPHGISFQATGTGESFFVQKIDNVFNEGIGSSNKNWQYWKNSKYPKEVGAGSQQLQPGDVVTWLFDTLPPVHLIINNGDGIETQFDKLSWSEGMTVEDLMKEAMAAPHAISFQATGTGASFFVKEMDNLLNQGGGTTASNWQYYLNTSCAHLGAGSQKLQPDDFVLWKFATAPQWGK